MWKASMSRYVLPDSVAVELLGSYNLFNDFPLEPGVVSANP